VPKGYSSVKIKYDNLQGKTLSTQSNYQADDIFKIDETLPNRETYWNKTARQLHKVPATTPQVVALFNFDEYDLTENSKKSIDTYINYLKDKPEMSAIIFGHTDSKGTDDYCNALSEKRAKEVMHYMIENGKIDKNRLIIRGFGKQYRVWEDDTVDWKAQENRRIEIVLVK
jgi:outer membrane protein OmpA-like peptidoglycan-associated protein